MKVFIHYQSRNASDAFEGTRLRKTLKGACEVVDVPWVDSPQPGVDVAHFLSPRDLVLLKEQKYKEGIPCVISAFYAEDDPDAAFLSPKEDAMALTKRSLEFLNEADHILVPDKRMEIFARQSGVTPPIDVLPPAVRMNRFSKTAIESKIFRRYFSIKPDIKTVVATGSYGDKKTLDLLKKVAECAPTLRFYFFGATPRKDLFSLKQKIASWHKPNNLFLQSIVQDDIYRSALMNSIAYISNDSVHPDPVGPLEAFASKTQVVAFISERPDPNLKEGETCFFFNQPEDMAEYLVALNSGTAESTIENAYAVAKSHNLIQYGKKLKQLYEALASGE